MENWNNQRQRPVAIAGSTNGIPYDARALFSVNMMGGQPVVMKYLYNYINYATGVPVNPLAKNGKWFLYRQTHLHLRFAEATNRDLRHRLAYGFINSGIKGAFPPPTGVTDVTNYQNTLRYPAPYNFDGREGNIPYFRSDWYRHIGIRARALVTEDTVAIGADSLLHIENSLINEGALENAFEGTRWPDLLRVARRRQDPAFLADKIYNKLQKDGIPGADAVKTRLMNKDNWYLPFKL
jgi:starch-binding outer membrane protein, SusD/RagB family